MPGYWHNLRTLFKQQLVTYSPTIAMVHDTSSACVDNQSRVHNGLQCPAMHLTVNIGNRTDIANVPLPVQVDGKKPFCYHPLCSMINLTMVPVSITALFKAKETSKAMDKGKGKAREALL